MATRLQATIMTPDLKQDQWFALDVPKGAVLRRFDAAGSRLHLWYEVDSAATTERKFVYCAGGGTDLPGNVGTFIGSVSIWSGQKTFFLYERVS